MSIQSTRIATHSDAEAAVGVLRTSIVELCTADHKNERALIDEWLANKTVANFHHWLESPGNACVVTESETGVHGVGLITRDGEIRLCYVAPDSIGRGYGSAILAALEDTALAWGVRTLRLGSTIAARQFYEKHGYVASAEASCCSFGVQCYSYEKNLTQRG
jgi:GNAT superfamily N-acetyltransferase